MYRQGLQRGISPNLPAQTGMGSYPPRLERALTEEELAERAALRREYIEEFRRGTIELLENTYIQTPDGKKHPLPRKGKTPPQ